MQKRIAPPEGFPFFGWIEESIKAYITSKPLQAGDQMIIYNGQGGMHHYMLATVVNPAHGKQRRVILSKPGSVGGTTFHRTGKNCFAPTGQTRMLPPVAELMADLGLDTDVWLNVPPYASGSR